jgi:hypothetical protein
VKLKAVLKKSLFKTQTMMKCLSSYQFAVLNQFGATVRMVARRSMRKGRWVKANGYPKRKLPYLVQRPSLPGKPPKYWVGTLRNMIDYHISDKDGDVVVGARLFRNKKVGTSTIPQIHEFGGSGMLRDRIKHRKVLKKFPARPYMKPAFDTVKKKLPAMMAKQRSKFKP